MFGLTVSLAPRGKKGKTGRMGPLQRATANRFPASEATDLLERSMDLLERSEAEQRFRWFREGPLAPQPLHRPPRALSSAFPRGMRNEHTRLLLPWSGSLGIVGKAGSRGSVPFCPHSSVCTGAYASLGDVQTEPAGQGTGWHSEGDKDPVSSAFWAILCSGFPRTSSIHGSPQPRLP